eukprot:3755662-Pleurochrysis_carterae.AAC.1
MAQEREDNLRVESAEIELERKRADEQVLQAKKEACELRQKLAEMQAEAKISREEAARYRAEAEMAARGAEASRRVHMRELSDGEVLVTSTPAARAGRVYARTHARATAVAAAAQVAAAARSVDSRSNSGGGRLARPDDGGGGGGGRGVGGSVIVSEGGRAGVGGSASASKSVRPLEFAVQTPRRAFARHGSTPIGACKSERAKAGGESVGGKALRTPINSASLGLRSSRADSSLKKAVHTVVAAVDRRDSRSYAAVTSADAAPQPQQSAQRSAKHDEHNAAIEDAATATAASMADTTS